jgi:hypothetical protein
VHPLGEVFVEDEAEDVVSELIRPHLPPQGVGDVPELGLKGLLVVFGHAVGVMVLKIWRNLTRRAWDIYRVRLQKTDIYAENPKFHTCRSSADMGRLSQG